MDRALFRQELFYRLSRVELQVAPLRSRPEDIVELTTHFLDRYRGVRRLQVEPAITDAMQLCHWPGNVREL